MPLLVFHFIPLFILAGGGGQGGDPCTDHQCMNGATCVPNGASDYTCKCTSGFTGKYCSGRSDLFFSLVAM